MDFRILGPLDVRDGDRQLALGGEAARLGLPPASLMTGSDRSGCLAKAPQLRPTLGDMSIHVRVGHA